MSVCNLQYSDLCVWTLPAMKIVRIPRDNDFLDSANSKATEIYK